MIKEKNFKSKSHSFSVTYSQEPLKIKTKNYTLSPSCHPCQWPPSLAVKDLISQWLIMKLLLSMLIFQNKFQVSISTPPTKPPMPKITATIHWGKNLHQPKRINTPSPLITVARSLLPLAIITNIEMPCVDF